jgi:hypothetical protein
LEPMQRLKDPNQIQIRLMMPILDNVKQANKLAFRHKRACSRALKLASLW